MTTFSSSLRRSALARQDLEVLCMTPEGTPGETPQTLDAIERSIDAPLPEPIRRLYLAEREVGLAWQEGAPSASFVELGVLSWPALSDPHSELWLQLPRDHSRRGGVVCIPRAGQVFQKGYWIDRLVPEPMDSELTIDGRALPDSVLYEDLYPFDMTAGYYIAGLWYDRERSDWRVVLGDDHGASWENYQTLDVEGYLQQLVDHLGGPRRWVTSQGEERELWSLAPSPAGIED